MEVDYVKANQHDRKNNFATKLTLMTKINKSPLYVSKNRKQVDHKEVIFCQPTTLGADSLKHHPNKGVSSLLQLSFCSFALLLFCLWY